eukprot:m.501739 g.501739  ORF g.501739 m.501739 type:complete len:128 (+) comp57333_c0_seq18:528-911(+)
MTTRMAQVTEQSLFRLARTARLGERVPCTSERLSCERHVSLLRQPSTHRVWSNSTDLCLPRYWLTFFDALWLEKGSKASKSDLVNERMSLTEALQALKLKLASFPDGHPKLASFTNIWFPAPLRISS